MTYVDHKRQAFEMGVRDAEDALKEAKFQLLCYDNHENLYKHNIRPGKAYPLMKRDSVLVSDEGLEKCVIDGVSLKRVSDVVGGSDRKDKALYRCSKCSAEYFVPLNEKDKKAFDKRMKDMRFGKIIKLPAT